VALLIKLRYWFATLKMCVLVNKHWLFPFPEIPLEISSKISDSFQLILFIRDEKPHPELS